MPWFKVDDDLAFHGKVVAAGNAAMGLWVRAGSWSAQTLTDGFIPKHMVATLGNTAQARKLVAAGLWHAVDGGYRFHQWGDRQPTRAEVDEKRAAARERMRRARGANKSDRSQDVRANNARTDDARSREQDPPPEHDFDEISTESDQNVNGRNHSVTESFDAADWSYPLVDEESDQDVRANFASSDANPVPSRPDPYIGVAPGEDRYVSNGAASEDDPPPPKFHPGHESGYVADCDDCAATYEARETWLAGLVAATEPPRHCPRHPGGTDTPCRACADMRKHHERWHTDRQRAAEERKRNAAAAQSAEARARAEDRARAIANCGLCDEHGYAGARVCDHDPGTVDRARRGSAAVRAALAEKAAQRAAAAANTPEPPDGSAGPSSDQPTHQDHRQETNA